MKARTAIVARLALLACLVAAALALVATPFAGAAPTALTSGVVEIQARYALSSGGGAGTGMVLTRSGEVLTNNHVIRGATQIRVHVPDTGRTYRARVLGYSISADVALLKLTDASGLETVSLGNSSTVDVGDEVTAVGNAGGSGITSKEGTITGRGVTITVGGGENVARLSRVLETSADLRQGDSGGPLLDDAGRVIGMNAAASVDRSGDSDGYAIPINRATGIAKQIRTGSSTALVHVGPTPFLGISIGAPAPGESVARGVLVAAVSPGSPAARAGLGRGDVIVSFNGNAVTSSSNLVTRLLRWNPGDRVRIGWVDALGNDEAAVVTLASGPPQ